ncbi:MAG TPA: hypothetical protein VE396_14505 [Xanthobacteraceae bacterium]|jgi:hypothetical protein|nr:hypothetical protein [Xanthobacteraceae bacterium]
MTDDNFVRDTVSANNGASESTVTTKNSIAHDAKIDVANCNGLDEAAASSENAIIEKVARLAKRYAAGTPSDEEFKALKAGLISKTSNSEKPASFRRENLARPLSMRSSENAWIALQAHVGDRVRPTTKARGQAKQHIPMVLTLAFFMCFVGPVYLDEAYAPLLPDKMDRMVGPATTIVPTNANEEPGASTGNARAAFRLGCEVGWNVIPPEQHCVSDSLWAQPEELFGGYRFFDPRAAFSTSPDQYLKSWARIRVPQDEAALQIPGSTPHETDREVPAEALDRPKLSSLSASSRDKLSLGAAAPSPPVSEHATVEQQHKTSPELRVEHLPSRANLTPLPQVRPKTIDD